jgi:hypothetical protein
VYSVTTTPTNLIGTCEKVEQIPRKIIKFKPQSKSKDEPSKKIKKKKAIG